MISQTAVFTRRIVDHMQPAVAIAADDSCGDLVRRLRAADASAAVVVDQQQRPLGMITERDISRRIAFSASAATPVARVMTAPVETIAGDQHLHRAVAGMRQRHIRHLPVVDQGRLVGLLELDRVLAAVSEQTVAQIDLVCPPDGDPESLRAAKHNQYRIAGQLLADQVPAAEVLQLLTRLNHDLYRRVVKRCLDAAATPPPAAFDVLVMGSGGRGENFLTPDQDNGLVIADYPDAEHDAANAWFVDFSVRLNQTLDRVGFPFCHGHVMARNPLWRKTLPQWRRQIDGWIRRGEGNFLRLCDIFFDFVCVAGEGELSRQLREHVTTNAARPLFLREMFKVDEVHDVALGPFGWLLPDRLPGPNRGKLHLKLTGTLPLVGAVRLLALRHRVAQTSTLERLEALRGLQRLGGDEFDELTAAYRNITGLLLRQQLRDAEAGLAPGNHVARGALSRRERRLLVDDFRAIRRFRSGLRTELTGELF